MPLDFVTLFPTAFDSGDGFGVGWYSGEREKEVPCVFLSVTPAWNNINCESDSVLLLHTSEETSRND